MSYAEVGCRIRGWIAESKRLEIVFFRTFLIAGLVLILAGMGVFAAQPVITGVSIPDVAMKIDDIVIAIISVQSDSATVYTLNASNIGGYALSSLSKQNSTTYTAQFTITEGGTDYAAGDTIPTDVTLADGALTDTWNTPISQANDPIDANRPTDPTPSSSSHTVSVWDNDSTVDIQVSGAGDPGGSGVDGFEIEWDQSATWVPTKTKEVEETWAGDTFTATANGDWYFHIATVDNAGNWTSTEHLGPFQIDTTPPSVSANLDPVDGSYTNDTSPTLSWDASTDTGGSGMRDTNTYRVIVTGPPDKDYYTANTTYTPTLAEGVFTWKVYARDNAGNSSAYTADHTLTIDTTDPTVSSITRDDPNPTNAAQVYMQVDFSESVTGVASNNFSIDATGGQMGASVDSVGLISGASWWVLLNTVDDAEGTLSINLNLNLANITDDAGNVLAAAFTAGQAYDVDRLDPTVTNVSVDDTVISDADAGGTLTVTVDFDEDMNQAQDPTITFAPTVGTTLAIVSDNWPDSDTYTATYNVSDANVDHDSVTIDVTNAEDLLENAQSDYAPLHEFEIDTANPAVTDVSVDTDLMYEGDLVQRVTVTFDEAMDTGTDPTITFGAGTFASNADGAWTVGDTVWTETFTLTDNNEEIAVVTVDVTGAKDAAGNDQEPYAAVDEFDIDTVKPTPVEIGMSHWDGDFFRYVIRESNAGEQFVIDMRYDESLDTNNEPTIVFSPDIVASGTLVFQGFTWINEFGANSRVQATYTIVDVNDTQIGVDVTIIGLTDVAGNPVSDDGTTHTDAIDVDTQGPTLATLVVTDTLLTDADDTSIFEVDATFSEDIKQFDDLEAGDPLPSIAFSADVLASGTLTELDIGWNGGTTDEIGGTYRVNDVNETQIGVDIIVDGVLDIYSNPLDPSPTTSADEFDVDTENPTVTSVVFLDSTAPYDLITDADTNDWPNAAAAHVTFSEPMTTDGSADPTITYAPDVDSTLPAATSFTQWDDVDEFLWGTEEVDANVDENSVTIDFSGAKDAAGNDMVDYTPLHEFEIDTVNPTVTNVSVDDVLITDADGGGTFTVTVDFSEAMTTDGSADPAIVFAPLIGTTLAFASENWPDSDTYTATYDVSDGNVDHDSVTIDVTGAKDANGNDQQDYSPLHEFEIDTLNPTITSITSTTPDGYYALGSSINVTVSFSEPVTLVGGTLDVTLDTPGDVVSLAAFGPATSSFTAYTIGAGDNSCDLDAIGIVLNGGTLRDNADNDAVVGLPATTIADGSDIAVDTTNPVISGLDLPDTEQSVDANCTITILYSTVVTDNCCVNAADVTVVVEFVSGAGTAILTAPPATIVNNGIDQVDVSGSFTVSDLTAGDVEIRVRINADDCATNSATEALDSVTIGDSTIPVISVDLPDGDLPVDANTCEYTVNYMATVTDNCCIDAGNVSVVVEFVPGFDTATLDAPAATIVNDGGSPNTQVNISGSFTVSALTNDPVQVRVRINAADCNGNAALETSDTATFVDTTIPLIGWDIELPAGPEYVSSDTCTITLPIQATVTDACCISAGNVTIDIDVTNATVVHTVVATQIAQGEVLVEGDITVSALTGCPAELSIAIDGTDCAGNAAVQLTDAIDIRDNTQPIIHADPDILLGVTGLRFDTDATHLFEQTVPYLVDECGAVTVYFSGNVTDNCCIVPANVIVTASLPMEPGEGPAILENFEYTPVQNGQGRVDFTGSAVVRCLESCPPSICPSRVQIDVTASDCCGNAATPVQTGTGEGLVSDDILPIPLDDPRQDMMMDESAIIDPLVEVRLDEFGTYRLILRESTPVRIDVMANDADNSSHNVAHPFAPCIQCGSCGGQTGCCATMYIHEIVEHPSYGTVDIEDDTGNCAGGTVIRYAPDRGYLGPDYFTYRTRDAFGNVSSVIATVYLQVVPEVWMEDVFVIACEGETVEFRVSAADLFIDPDDPSIIQFAFSIAGGPEHGIIGGSLLDVVYTPPSTITDPRFGVQVPSLDFSEAAAIVLTYTPADGFLGRDQLRIRFEDPFGGVAIAVVNITVGQCIDVAEFVVIHVVQGQLLPLVVPLSFASVLDAGMGTVTLISLEDGTLYLDAITAEWSEAINRHILTLNTAGLPLGSYELKIPLGTGEIVTLTIEVGEGE